MNSSARVSQQNPTSTEDLNMYTLAILLIIGLVVAFTTILITYCRLIPCAWCREPWAVHHRAAGDLCRSCAAVFDLHRIKIGHKRSLLRRIQIWRAA